MRKNRYIPTVALVTAGILVILVTGFYLFGTPTDRRTGLRFVEADFGLDGSYFLKYQSKETGMVKLIQIKCPDPIRYDASPEILEASYVMDGDLATQVFSPMSKTDVRELVRVRFGELNGDVDKREAEWLMILFLHSEGIATVKNWGMGFGLANNGEWFRVFRKPDASPDAYK